MRRCPTASASSEKPVRADHDGPTRDGQVAVGRESRRALAGLPELRIAGQGWQRRGDAEARGADFDAGGARRRFEVGGVEAMIYSFIELDPKSRFLRRSQWTSGTLIYELVVAICMMGSTLLHLMTCRGACSGKYGRLWLP